MKTLKCDFCYKKDKYYKILPVRELIRPNPWANLNICKNCSLRGYDLNQTILNKAARDKSKIP